jgi:hypothetical protein
MEPPKYTAENSAANIPPVTIVAVAVIVVILLIFAVVVLLDIWFETCLLFMSNENLYFLLLRIAVYLPLTVKANIINNFFAARPYYLCDLDIMMRSTVSCF